ncbi:hypothetical protein [Paenibacillus qinlingensis]|uniref:hypothetical protein n=1 Tax=Paenibacillus qinlingensis TaxID=1837343 RepID=UPI001566AB90|nr:hypothetical protein [Paenibacillus qinlingensis]NQX62207.1 hypothetical protein [Paenibacillus qinlingensis]
MEELINEVSARKKMYEIKLMRLKKGHDYSFTSDTAHYYSLILAQNTHDAWQQINELLLKYKRIRVDPTIVFKSDVFEKMMTFERNSSPGFITIRTQAEMIKYMKQLEWKVNELEAKLSCESIVAPN